MAEEAEIVCIKLFVNEDNVREFSKWLESMYLSRRDILYD